MSSRADHARPLPAATPTAPSLRAIACALLVPLVATLLGVLPWRVLPHVDGHDRALVWIAGSDAALRDAAARLAAEPAFRGGATTAVPDAEARAPGAIAAAQHAPSPALLLPAHCPRDAVRLHFDFSRTDQAQAARAALERIAAAAGARVCGSHRFELNHEGARSTLWLPLAASLLMPMGLLVAMRRLWPARPAQAQADAHATMRTQASIATPFAGPAAIALLLAGIAATCVVALPAMSAGAGTAALMLAMALGPAAIHEAAFRGWLVPRLAPAAGQRPALVVSFVASVVFMLPFAGAASLATTAAASAAGCIAFARSRSLSACIGAHLLVAALARLSPDM